MRTLKQCCLYSKLKTDKKFIRSHSLADSQGYSKTDEKIKMGLDEKLIGEFGGHCVHRLLNDPI